MQIEKKNISTGSFEQLQEFYKDEITYKRSQSYRRKLNKNSSDFNLYNYSIWCCVT